MIYKIKSRSTYFKEIENDSCEDFGKCNVRLCCPSISESGISEFGSFECSEERLFEEASSGPFYTSWFEGFDYVQKRRNVLLDDADFRFDICQAFAAQKISESIELQSFLFKESSFQNSDSENYEIDGDKIRYCCAGSRSPTEQLDNIIDNFLNKIESSGSFSTKRKFNARFQKVMKKRRQNLKNEFEKKEEHCVFAPTTELM